ncbi:transposase, partial [Shigella sonnei]
STSKTPSYTKSVSWQHHRYGVPECLQCWQRVIC